MDIQEQIVNIVKANAYDIQSEHFGKVKGQNDNFRKALNDVLDTITTAPPSEISDNPAVILRKIADHCLNALRNNKHL